MNIGELRKYMENRAESSARYCDKLMLLIVVLGIKIVERGNFDRDIDKIW